MLSLRLCLGQRLTHVAWIADLFASYRENDIAGLKAMFGGGAFRIDTYDDDTLAAGAGHFIRRSKGEAELGRTVALLRFLVARVGLPLIGKLAEGNGDRIRLALPNEVQFYRTAGRQRRNFLSKVAGVLDRATIERADDIAGFDTGRRLPKTKGAGAVIVSTSAS